MRNNIQENTTSKDKSKRNFHPSHLLAPQLTKKQFIIDFIKQTIVNKGKCTYSQGTIATMYGVTKSYVNKIYKQLKEDPVYSIVTFKITPIKNRTCIVKFVFIISLLLSAKSIPLSLNKNYLLNNVTYTYTVRAHTRARDINETKRNDRKEKETKTEHKVTERNANEAIENIKNITLTEVGKAKVSVFPNAAIEYADGQLKFAKPTDSFRFFCYNANNWCKDRNIRPDHKRWFDLKAKFNYTDDLPNYEKRSQIPQKQEQREVPSSVNDLLRTIVKRKAIAYMNSGVSQSKTMRNLEGLAKSNAIAESDWEAWSASEEAYPFWNWLNTYTSLYPTYAHWNPFTFDREWHNNKVKEEDAKRLEKVEHGSNL